MDTEARSIERRLERAKAEREPAREEMRAARGLLVGLALSAIFWLGLLVVWLAV